MWIYFKVDRRFSSGTIRLPLSFKDLLGNEVFLCFGVRTHKVTLKFNPRAVSKTTFDSPIQISCSTDILEKLEIPDGCVFRIKAVNRSQLLLGPVIGFLFGEQQYLYNDRMMKEFKDSMKVYREVGGLFFGFKPSSINWDTNTVYGLYYHPTNQKWMYGKFPIPLVVYRRTFNYGHEEVQRLRDKYGVKVFNPFKLDKWEMYLLLKENSTLSHYLPETMLLKKESLLRFLERYNMVIIKPVDLSRGRGITIIERTKVGYKLNITEEYGKKNSNKILPFSDLVYYLESEGCFVRKFIIQPFLNLKKINYSSWDIRVVMQKNYRFKWQCSGIECRLASSNQMLTNISVGGRALTINTALMLSFGNRMNRKYFLRKLLKVAKEICFEMDRQDDYFAEFGMDLCIDENADFWFIEANTRPSFNGFKLLDMTTYDHIFRTPMLYAAALAGFQKEARHV